MRIAGYLKFGFVVVLGAGAAVLIAPQRTSTALRVAVFLLAAAAAVALVDVARRHSPAADTSPFEPRRGRPVTAGAPADLVRYAVDMRAFDASSGHGALPTVVPGALRRAMRNVAASRLAVSPGSTISEPLRAALDGEPVTATTDELMTALEQL